MTFIIQELIIGLIGIIIGTFFSVLFFRIDNTWKQSLVELGGLILTGILGKSIEMYFAVSKEDSIKLYLTLILAVIISFSFTFRKMVSLLKAQSGTNIIRVLDILLGYDGFIKDYYKSRKKDIELKANNDYVKREKARLKSKEKLLDLKEQALKEQSNDALVLDLPEKNEYPITKHFIEEIPFFVNHISSFENNLDRMTDEFLELFTQDREYNAECLKGFFAGIGMYVANDLFGTSRDDVRTHFRILRDDKYVQYSVVVGQKMSEDKITDIPRNNSGTIGKSYELKKSLVASLNPESIYNTKTKWEDYMTITYYNFLYDKAPFLSMGISIKYGEQFRDMLYFLNFYKIEDTLQKYMNKINDVCNIVDTLKEC